MSDPETMPGGSAGLVLGYLRVLTWPLVLVIGILVFRGDISAILQNREIEIGSLKIGGQVAEIEENVNDELDEINRLIEELTATSSANGVVDEKAEEINTRVAALKENLKKDLQQVRQETEPVAPPAAVAEPRAEAKQLERIGFEALAAGNVDEAIDAFGQASKLWPDYHNVSEIHRLLSANRQALASRDRTAWMTVRERILKEYSWGMPTDIRTQLRSRPDAVRSPRPGA